MAAVVAAALLWFSPVATMASEAASSDAASATVPVCQPLSDFDVQQYQRLFHQEMGRMKQATREMGRLESDLLKGHCCRSAIFTRLPGGRV